MDAEITLDEMLKYLDYVQRERGEKQLHAVLDVIATNYYVDDHGFYPCYPEAA